MTELGINGGPDGFSLYINSDKVLARYYCQFLIKKGLVYDKTRAYQRNYERCTSDSAE